MVTTQFENIKHWIDQYKWFILLLIIFNCILFGAVVLIEDPTLLFVLMFFMISFLFYIFMPVNFWECFLLVLFLFLIELLYSGLGLFALLSGFLIVAWFILLKAFMAPKSHFGKPLFIKEIGFFLTIVFISLLTGAVLFNGIRLFFLNLILGLCVLLATHIICSSLRSLEYVTIFIITFFILNAVYALIYSVSTGFRATSLSVGTPTYSAHLFVQGIAVTVGAILSNRFVRYKKIFTICIVILLMALFLSLTRAAWLSLFLLILLSLFFTKIPKRYILYVVLGIVLIVTVSFFYLRTDTFIFMLKDRLASDVQKANLSAGSIALRILLWKSAWSLFLQSPILGIGFDNFVIVNKTTEFYNIIKGLGFTDLYVHNVYLQLLAEIGILGFLSFIYLIWRIFKTISNLLKKVGHNSYRFFILGYAGATVLWLFMAITEASLYTPITAIFFFFYLGILSGFHKNIDDIRFD